MSLLQPMMVAALLVSGMGVALLGSFKVPLARRLQIDEARVGGLISVFGFTMIPVIFTAGLLTDWLGKQGVLMGGSVLFAASLFLLGRARNYPSALAAVVLLSGAWSLLINVGNVLVVPAFGGGGQSEAFATNLANVFFGLGAFLTPLAAAFLLRHLTFAMALGLVGGLALVPAVLALGVDFASLGPAPDPKTPAGTMWQELGNLLSDPMLWLLGLALFFYGPLEASMAGWATTFLGDKGLSEGAAANLLSAFWLTFMASRLVTAFSLPHGLEAVFVFELALLSVAVLLGVVVSKTQALAVGAVAAAGLVFGPIFPTLMAILLGHFPATVHGRAVGLFFAIGGIGWTVIPILIGAYARRTSVQRGFVIAVAAAVGLSGLALLLAMR
jgi:fucose permease